MLLGVLLESFIIYPAMVSMFVEASSLETNISYYFIYICRHNLLLRHVILLDSFMPIDLFTFHLLYAGR